MKNFLYILIVLVFSSCTDDKKTPTELVNEYYNGFKKSDYKQVEEVIAGSLTTVAGDYTDTYTHESYHEKFKWDSIFKPVYKLVSLENQEQQIVATVTINSLKLEFLKNNPMTCKYKFHFKSGKIFRIEELNCLDANWQTWEKQVNTLVAWIKLNHPELDGFIYDLSMKGALNYIKAAS